jgi:membrane-bound lytic murein transglycosylase F
MGTCSQPNSLLEEVRALGELRAVTRNSPTTFYTGPRGPEGPEYDLIRGFATFLGVELRLETVDRFADLIPTVESGAAHVAAAGLTITPERAQRVDFGPAYQTVTQYLVYKLGTGRPADFDDLAGKELQVVAGTSYVETLRKIQRRERDIVWTEHPHADVAELLLLVAEQEIDYTVADSSLFEVYRNFVPEIRVGFELAIGDNLAWAFPKRADRSLIEQAERYMEFIRSNGDLDRVMDRYYGHTESFDYVGTRRFMRDYESELPRFRELFTEAADDLGMDWRLLAAMSYQESHWDPEAVSPTGVRGLMMLTQNTARYIGVDDRIDPAQSIEGGAEYLGRVKRRFAAAIDEPDRTWFALAAYNVGYGHVLDARKLAREDGQDPNIWVHVKDYLPLLTQHKYYSKTTHGYARGWEPVAYVENVRNYYDILIWLTSTGEPDQGEAEDTLETIASAREATAILTGG